ncbi:hypothetical protein, partial [Methylobacterium sp. WL116]|uniref:hypothetical protein n=1 Tax=Methylobacterium sp. WL116 TaxID=2603889 RepID=UPI001AED2658
MSKPDPFAALDGGGSGRLSLPFLPTLVTALVLGAGFRAAAEADQVVGVPERAGQERALVAGQPVRGLPLRVVAQ